MFIQVSVFEAESVGGLLSPEYIGAAWSWAKVVDLLKHIWVPILVIGTGSTAGVIRIMRGNLLDILGQQHIQTGRAKGLKEGKVIVKYGVRIAINPLVSRLGLELPGLLSGAVVTGIVLGLPTAGPHFSDRAHLARHVFGGCIPALVRHVFARRQFVGGYSFGMARSEDSL